MNWKKIVGLASFCLLAAAAPTSHAESIANAQLSGFTFTLIDLDPGDGIAPSLTLTNPSYWIAAAAYPDSSGPPNTVDIINHPGGASVTDSTGGTTSLYVDTLAFSFTHVSGTSPRFSADTIVQWDFALTPHTAAVIMGYGSISSLQTTDAVVNAYAAVFASYKTNPADLYESYFDDSLYSYRGPQQSKVLNITVIAGNAELDGRLGFSTSTSGQSLAAPVPEPETYAMFLGGMVVVAFARRRSKA